MSCESTTTTPPRHGQPELPCDTAAEKEAQQWHENFEPFDWASNDIPKAAWTFLEAQGERSLEVTPADKRDGSPTALNVSLCKAQHIWQLHCCTADLTCTLCQEHICLQPVIPTGFIGRKEGCEPPDKVATACSQLVHVEKAPADAPALLFVLSCSLAPPQSQSMLYL